MGAVSALRIREAKREAASPSNPDHDKAKKGEEGNTNLESKATGNGGKATVPQDVAATEQKVTGDIGNLDPAVRDLVKNEGAIMQKAGGSMVEANSAQYQAGAAKKPQEASVAATH